MYTVEVGLVRCLCETLDTENVEVGVVHELFK